MTRLTAGADVRARRAGLVVLVACAFALAGCSDGEGKKPDAAPSATPSASLPAAAQARCLAVVGSDGLARKVVETAQAGPVLTPAVALLLLDLREKAAAAVGEPAPYGQVFRDLVAAIDELDGQGKALLPEGSDPVSTPVRLDTARLEAALDAVRSTCGPLPSATPTPSTTTTVMPAGR